MKNVAILAFPLALTASFAQAAGPEETLRLECERENPPHSIDTARTAKLALHGTDAPDQFGQIRTKYRLVYSFRNIGMHGGTQVGFTREFADLTCWLDGTRSFECYRFTETGVVDLEVSMIGGTLNVLAPNRIYKSTGRREEEYPEELFAIESEGTALLFNKPTGECRVPAAPQP